MHIQLWQVLALAMLSLLGCTKRQPADQPPSKQNASQQNQPTTRSSSETAAANTAVAPAEVVDNSKIEGPEKAVAPHAAGGEDRERSSAAPDGEMLATETKPSETQSSETQSSETQSSETQASKTQASKTAPADKQSAKFMPQPQSVSTMRLAILAPGGPRLVKIDVHVGGRDLTSGSESAANHLAKELEMDFTAPLSWSDLLDKPLVGSGWLGNLVPTTEQRDQLIAMYDANKDGKAESSEFRAFVTRGLSRGSQLRLAPSADASNLLAFESPWGPMDNDEDGELSAQELSEVTAALMKYDFDADKIVAAGELRSSNGETGQPMMNNSRRGLMEYKPIANWDVQKPQALANTLMEFYTYSDGVSRELFDRWDDARFTLVDTNQDGTLSESELLALSDSALHAATTIAFADAFAKSAVPPDDQIGFDPTLPAPSGEGKELSDAWLVSADGGRIDMGNCILTIKLRDDYAQSSKERFADIIKQVPNNPQFEQVLTSTLDLKGGAIDLVRPKQMDEPPPASADASDQKMEQSEAGSSSGQAKASVIPSNTNEPIESRAWGWVIGPRQFHIQVLWSVSQAPWFELLDSDGDGRLTNGELEQFRKNALHLDKDQDGRLGREEMPLSIVLTVARSDVRGAALRLGGMSAEKRGTNPSSSPTWFTGMDYNSDGELSQSEFLGEASDFEKLDRNRDGVIEAREINAP